MRQWLPIPFALAASAAAAQEVPDSVRRAAESAPLFATHDLLEIAIQAPFNPIFRERGQESEEYDGVVSYYPDPVVDSLVNIDVEIRTRGRFRLQRNICEFPPLRLDFPKDDVGGTVFAGQDKLKLVTHCDDDRREYEQYVLLEYLAYRIYNLLTPFSFRVRQLRVTYLDAESRRDVMARYGFLIEDEDMLAARLGYQSLSIPQILPGQVDQRQIAIFELFQYLIGNTDWSAFRAAPDEDECCHNTKLIGFSWGPVYPVPYDFDWSGLVNARYARPDPRVGVRSVRQRRFWGVCRPQEELEAVVPLFNERRDAIDALVRGQEGLTEDRVEETIEYLDEFYEVINDPQRFEREVVRRCREYRVSR